jgi:PKD domain
MVKRSVAVGALALGLFVACSSKADDGGSCEKGAECSSGVCFAGACEGSDCTCDTSDCRTRSSCQAGWLCTRGDVTSDVITRCRKECKDSSECTSDKHCDNGICKAGAQTFSLTWLNIPRTSPCGAHVPCEYKAAASAGVNVSTYAWTFGGVAAPATHDPTTSFTYDKGGSYEAVVTATSDKGATAVLRTTEVLCEGGVGAPCDTSSTLCCQGTCIADLCK